MSTTFEMLFACCLCGTERQYGCAENYRHTPDETHPKINCIKCLGVTVHRFVGVKERMTEGKYDYTPV